jgi:disulfide oxidoreductase YuzD
MAQGTPHVTVNVIAAASGECGSPMTWASATEALDRRLKRRFPGQVSVQYVELFAPESFMFVGVMKGIQEERYHLPIVLVDGEIISEGKKLDMGHISRHVGERLKQSTG